MPVPSHGFGTGPLAGKPSSKPFDIHHHRSQQPTKVDRTTNNGIRRFDFRHPHLRGPTEVVPPR
ncbi:MAG: hypothetical protein OEW91_11680, partial [Acidimicrobiia bacterium]|nr:hypothetical protein [Acidimicrobiia bacterium]